MYRGSTAGSFCRIQAEREERGRRGRGRDDVSAHMKLLY